MILLAFAIQRPVMLAAGAIICAAYALFHYRSACISNTQLLFFLLISALFLPGIINFYHGLSPAFYYFSTVASFYAAGAVTRHKPEVLMAAFRLVYWGSIVVISIILYEYWDYVEPLGMAITGSSTNAIPSYLLVIQIGLSLCNFLVHGRLPVFSPIATGVIAFLGNGRSSIVVAGLIIVVSLFFNLWLTGSISRKRQLIFFLILTSMVIPLVWNAEELIDLLLRYTKLSVGLVDENRLEILGEYWGKIEPWTFIFGADYAGTVIESVYLGNPHIAYIRTHSFFGLPLTILAMISPIFVLLCRKVLIAKLVFACFIGLAAIRASSEPLFFPTLLDFFYFTYFFLFFRYTQSGSIARRGPVSVVN
jgi:hypothetical protein